MNGSAFLEILALFDEKKEHTGKRTRITRAAGDPHYSSGLMNVLQKSANFFGFLPDASLTSDVSSWPLPREREE